MKRFIIAAILFLFFAVSAFGTLEVNDVNIINSLLVGGDANIVGDLTSASGSITLTAGTMTAEQITSTDDADITGTLTAAALEATASSGSDWNALRFWNYAPPAPGDVIIDVRHTTSELKGGKIVFNVRDSYASAAAAFTDVQFYSTNANTDTLVLTLYSDGSAAFTGALGAGAITGTSLTDGTTTIDDGDYTGVGNITGSDVDIEAGTGDFNTSGTLDAGAITGTSISAHTYGATTGSKFSYHSADGITPNYDAIYELVSDSSNLLPTAIEGGMNLNIYLDGTNATTQWTPGLFVDAFLYGTQADTKRLVGVYGGATSRVNNNANNLYVYGLYYTASHREDFPAGGLGSKDLWTYGTWLQSYFGWDGNTISNDSTVINYGAKIESYMDGTFNASNDAGQNYGLHVTTTDNLDDGTQDITSYGVYIAACAADANIGSGGALTSWGLYSASDVNNAINGRLRVGDTTAPTTTLDVVGDASIGDDTNDLRVESNADTYWTGTAGLVFGNCYGNHIGWDANSPGVAEQNIWYNIADSDMTDDSTLNLVTHDGNGKLTVTKPGMYLINYSVCFQDNVANDHIEIGIEVSGSGSANGAGQVHLENKFANEEEHSGSSCILDLADNATIECAIRTTDADGPVISVQAVNITVVQIGGT